MYEKIKKDIAQEYYVKNYPNDGGILYQVSAHVGL